jgi:Fe-S-cluster containining protein
LKDCNQCGKCCTNYGGGGGLSASAREIDAWAEHRPDIHNYVRNGQIWFSPVTGQQLQRCPWLRKLPGQSRYICRIYSDRPEDCRHYPVDIEQMVRDECEMLERHDLRNVRQAQRQLDNLMADSRPAVERR